KKMALNSNENMLSYINVGILKVSEKTEDNVEYLSMILETSISYIENALFSVDYSEIRTVLKQETNDASKLELLVNEWLYSANINAIFVIGKTDCFLTWSVPQVNQNREFELVMFSDVSDESGEINFLRLSKLYINKSTNAVIFHVPDESLMCELSFGSKINELLQKACRSRGQNDYMESIQKATITKSQPCKSKVVPVKVSDRHRKSPYPMISVTEATELVLKESSPMQKIWKDARGCYSHILAENIIASEPYPPFPASIKDGYAVLADDKSEIRKVIGTVTPGCQLNFDLKSGSCVRVSTGSVVPDKADAVIQVEDTSIVEKDEEGNEISIKIEKQVNKRFQDIRAVGSDVTQGDVIIAERHKILAAEIGIMATCGIKKALVFQKPLVALLSTGDEVMEPGTPLSPGFIRDCNRSSLEFMLYENKVPVVDCGIAKDSADDYKGHLLAAFKAADIIVTSGSVSMGEKDILKQVLQVDFGAVIHFGRIHMKPGKPTTFATLNFEGKKKLVFCLPGNPVSSFVCFYLFVIPCVKTLMGFKEPRHIPVNVKLAHDLLLDERPEYHRVFLKYDDCTFVAHSTGAQQSSRFLSMLNADAFLVLPPKTDQQSVLKTGSIVKAILVKSI
ncbi:gephyrin, partial [Trichonephila clavata]